MGDPEPILVTPLAQVCVCVICCNFFYITYAFVISYSILLDTQLDGPNKLF